MAKGDFSMYLDSTSYIEVEKKLAALSKMEQEAVVAQGLKEGAQLITKRTKENIKSKQLIKTGNLLKSATVKVRKKDGKAYAGFRRPIGAHAHLIEFGTKVRKTKNGANRGQITGQHFHTDAVEQSQQEAIKTIQESVEKSIRRIMDRN